MVAQHCSELLGRKVPAMDDLVPALAIMADRLARNIALGLARLSGSEPPLVRCATPRIALADELSLDAQTLTSYSVLGIGPERERVLLTCAAAPVFRLVDRAFGGRGALPHPMPPSFPLSAELLAQRLEQTIAFALQEALGLCELTVQPIARHTNCSHVTPFAPGDTACEVSLSIEEPGCEPWALSLAFAQPTLAALFAGREHDVSAALARRLPDVMDEPFASLPITLTAIVVDMKVPFTRMAALRPGDIIPIAFARSVPLKAGDHTIASGTIGEFEDRVAIQITTAF